jgi:hypothetical protein
VGPRCDDRRSCQREQGTARPAAPCAHERSGVLQEKIRVLKEEQEKKRAADGPSFPCGSGGTPRIVGRKTSRRSVAIMRRIETTIAMIASGGLQASDAKLEEKVQELTDEKRELEGCAEQYKQDCETRLASIDAS